MPEGNEQLLCFGLLQSVETVLDVTCLVSFNFLHLTFMEYLAALHLSRQPLQRQLEILKEDRFTMEVRFFFGICFSSLNRDEISDLKQALECVSGKHDILHICHCALEAQNKFVCSKAALSLSANEFSYYPRNPHDCAAVLYVIAHIQECSGLDINFNNCGVRDNQIRTLADTLASKYGKLQVYNLGLRGNKLTDKTVSYLFNTASAAFQSLTYLDFCRNSIRAESIKSITTALVKSSSDGLENSLCDGVLSNLEWLSLSESLTSDADTNASLLSTLGEALSSHCPHLLCLGLDHNNLGVPGAIALLARVISRLQHYSTKNKDSGWDIPLSFVSLNQTNLGDKGLCAFVDSLEGVCHFNGLSLDDNDIHSSGISCLVNAVCSGKVVLQNELVLDDNLLGLEGALAVSRMLSSNQCQLTGLFLSRCKLTTAGVGLPNTDPLNVGNNIHVYSESVRDVGQQLCQMSQNNTIPMLDLEGNSFTGNSINILAAFMYLCPGLEYLYTRNCEITSDDLIQLFCTLSSLQSSSSSLCSMLHAWYLDSNAISDSGVSALIDHLPSLFPSLGSGNSEIRLYNNPAVTSEMKKKLEDELRRRREVRCYVKQL